MNLSIEDEGGYAMTSWTRNDLERIGAADELLLASFKKDGTHLAFYAGWPSAMTAVNIAMEVLAETE
jgi:alkylhydroperoxidase/carboxymuconolactone decarboxylase family protein YurZ